MKRIYLLFLFFMFLLQVSAQTGTYTANGVEWKFTISNGEATITGTTEGTTYAGPLNIPDKVTYNGADYTVTATGEGAFNFYKQATSLTLPNTLKKIGGGSFSDCSSLANDLVLPSSLTEIGTSAFSYCESLTGQLIIPAGVAKIADATFYNCNFTGALVIHDGITSIGSNAFYGCSSLTSVTIGNSVRTIGKYAFRGCVSLTSLSLGNSVENIGEWAFGNCTLLSALTIPNSVKTIGFNAFYSCPKLTSLTLGNSVKTIGYSAFEYCTSLSGALTIPSSVETIGQKAFSRTNFDSVTFGENSAYTYVAGNYNVWENCNNLKYIDMRGLASPLNTTISRQYANVLFRGTRNYTMTYLPAGSTQVIAGEENFVVGDVCDKFVVYDYDGSYKSGTVGCDYRILHPFTAKQAIYYSRTFTGTTCKTLCLPFPVKLPNEMRAYELKKKLSDLDMYQFVSVPNGSMLAANKPYLMRIATGNNLTFATSVNVSVPVTPSSIEEQASDDETSFFGGTTTNIDNATAASQQMYNLSNNKWMPITLANTAGFVRSFRAYIRTTSSAPAKQFALVLDDDTTTGIDAMINDVEQGDGEIFTIDGRSVGRDLNTLKNGEIYIKNGKKFYKF